MAAIKTASLPWLSNLADFFGSLARSDLTTLLTMFQTYTQPIFMVFHNGLVIVDTFFLISGFVTSFQLLTKFYNNGNNLKKLSLVIFLRYFRIISSFMVVVGFMGTVWKYLGDGPFWKSIAVEETKRCTETAWITLLLLNNYLQPERMVSHKWLPHVKPIEILDF